MWYNKIMKAIGNFFKGIIGFIVTILILIVYLPFWLLFPTRVVGRKNLKSVKGGAVVACNHYSNFDVIYLTVNLFQNGFKRKYLAKRELNKNKFLGFLLSSIGAIYITRGAVDRQAIREVGTALDKKKHLLVFPEGTRNKTESDDMLAIKSGAVFFAKRSNVPIVPIRMEKRSRIFRFNRIVIGEPYMVGESGDLSTDEEVKKLETKFADLIK